MLFDNDYVLWLRCIYQALVEQNNTRHVFHHISNNEKRVKNTTRDVCGLEEF